MAVFSATKTFNATSLLDLASLVTSAISGGATLSNTSSGGFTLTVGTKVLTVTGSAFTYGQISVPGFPGLPSFKFPITGTISGAVLSQSNSAIYSLTDLSLPLLNLLNPANLTPSVLFKGADTLIGSKGNDTLSGYAGDDRVRGGDGKDTLDGGGFGGRDTVDYSDKTDGISLTLSMIASSQVKVGGVIEDTIKNFQDVYGGSGNDVIKGDGRENKINGGAGNDKLYGAAGYDYLTGGDGNDILQSGASDPFAGDTMVGGKGTDTADYSDMTGDISVNLSIKDTQYKFWSQVKLDGTFTEWIAEFENLWGGKGDDSLTGDAGRNVLRGGAGNDVLNGLGGSDGASFSDKTTGLTIALKNGAEVSVVISPSETDKISNIEDLEGGSGNDQFTGDTLDNKLYGGAGADTLKGGGGSDILNGEEDSDTLRGDAGADFFRFDVKPSATSGFDVIQDFNVADDQIQLSKTAFQALGSTVTADEFLVGTGSGLKAGNVSQHLIYRKDSGDLFYDADGSASAAAQIKIAQLTGSPDTLSFADFVMI